MASNKLVLARRPTLLKAPVKLIPSGGGRLFNPPSTTIRGVSGDTWFGPLQPVRPIAPTGTEPRGFQYTPGQNLIYTPRATEDLTFDDLREFARYPVVRYIIETRKDQICRQSWSIRVKPKPGESNRQRLAREQGDKIVHQLTSFFQYPNPDCAWRDFLRMWMEDVLVIDAPAILLRRTKAGDVAQMRVVDGALITRYIDENGWTPQGKNNPAYAQLWYGIPMVDLTADQLVYRPSNPRTNKLYGLSRVEQAYKHIELGSRRLEMQLQYYENGSIPDGIMIVPPTATPEQIERQQNWMNSTMAGNLARRVQLRLIQGFNVDGKAEQILFPKERLITDETDDLIIRSLCFAFQVSPQRWMKMVNRASAEASQEAAEEEGLAPTKDYVRDTCNYIIQVKMGFPDHEFAWADHRDPDILKQAQADKIYVDSGINTVNEIRESKGDDPSPNPAADQLNIVTSQGTVELGQVLQLKQLGAGGPEKPKGGKTVRRAEGGASPNRPAPPKAGKMVKAAVRMPSTQIDLPTCYAAEILELCKSMIPDEHLMAKGREDNPHVTLKYGIREDGDCLQKILADTEPFEVSLGSVMVFPASENSGGACPVVIKVVSAGLRRLRRSINNEMSNLEDQFDYNPHVTLAYVDPDYADEYEGLDDLGDIRFMVNEVQLCKMDGTRTAYPVGKPNVPLTD